MVRGIINGLARLFKGPQYSISESVPVGILAGFGLRRFLSLVRGIVRLRAAVFVEHGVTIRNAGHLRIGRGSTLQRGAYLDAFAKTGINLGLNCNIGPYVQIQATGVMTNVGGGLRVGDNCGVGAFSFFGCGGGITIGSDVIMGQYVSFHAESHLYDDLGKVIREQGVTRKGIEIGDGCWIGAKATFLDGTSVGSGVVVAAGSVVRGKIPDDVVIGGIPARILRRRGPKDAI
jgi:acetyltransferase-like isoleucine patch superfamily enzyme